MSEREITFTVSEELYQRMREAQVVYAVLTLADLARQAVEEKVEEARLHVYRQELEKLRQGIQEAGRLKALGLGETKEEVIDNLRKIRQEIFEQEYAHLPVLP